MFNNLKEKIKNKKLILFGETHGTKGTPELLSKFFSETAKKEDFNLCLEIPEEFQNVELYKILSLAKKIGSSGLISKNYIELIKSMPKNVKVFFVAPSTIKNQEDMENILSKNILKIINNKKTFAILGEIHASKLEIDFKNIKIIPTGLLMYKKIGDKMMNIRITGKKDLDGEWEKNFNKGFDEIIEVEKLG